MAYISYPNYTPPTSWFDFGMDWRRPDPSNRVYLDALWMAFQERMRVIQGSSDGSSAYHDNQYNSLYHPSYSLYDVNRISYMRDMLLSTSVSNVLKRYWVPNPDATAASVTPLVTLYSQCIAGAGDDQWQYLNIGDGQLISGTQAVNCFKALKHFFDKMTIVDSLQDNFIYDVWTGNDNGNDPIDSWSDCWANLNVAENFVIETDVRNWGFGGTLRGRDSGTFVGVKNVKWIPFSTLAHNLLLQFGQDSDPPNVSTIWFYRFWDMYHTGWTNNGYNVVPIPANVGTHQITTGFYPPDPYVAWDWVDASTPYHSNTVYRSSTIGYGWVDYGVKDGFSFQPTRYSDE